MATSGGLATPPDARRSVGHDVHDPEATATTPEELTALAESVMNDTPPEGHLADGSQVGGSRSSRSRTRRKRSRWRRWRARRRRTRRRRARHRAMRTGPLQRVAEQRARRRRRQRARRRRSDLNRTDAEVARIRRRRRRAARRRARRIHRTRRAARREARPRRWRDRPGRTRRAEARLRRALRINTIRQKLPALSWYRGLPERTRVTRWEVVALVVIALAASAGVATSSKNPTGSPALDLGWSLVVGTIVALAGTRAPRRVLLASGALAAVGVPGWWGLAGLGAMALASGLVYRRRGRIVGLRAMHAASAALTLTALVRVPPLRWFPGGPAWALVALGLAGLVIAAIVVSGWWNSRPRIRLVTAAFAGVGLLVVMALSGALWSSVRQVPVAEEVALVAIGTTEGTSDLTASVASLQRAAPAINDLADRLESPWWTPLRAVPIVAQQLEALDATASGARDLIERAGEGAALVNGSDLRVEPGRVDLAALEALESPLADLAATLASTDERLTAARGSLLVPAVAQLVDELQTATAAARPATELALQGTRAVATMLGAEGPRTWLVQVVGTAGNQVQLVQATDGAITPIAQSLDPTLVASLGDLSTSPDYPAAAADAAVRLDQAGLTVDGIMTLDTAGAASLAAALGAPGAASDPASLLTALGATTLPSPTELGDALRTDADERRILLWSSHPEEEAFLDAVGVAGSLRRNDGTVDLVYVALNTSGSDTPLPEVQRRLTYTTTFDAASGETRTSARLELTRIPSAADPTAGRPARATLTLITGLELNRIRIAGIAREPERGSISGWDQWTMPVTIPATGSVTVQWSLQGQFPPFEYEFAWQPQPAPTPTQVTWRFAWTIYGSEGEYSTFVDRPLPTAYTYAAQVR